jgi:murein L,D-transpeptidase YafK
VPEGYYHIVGFNAASAYLLSLRLDYPNAADRARAAAASRDPGGDIFLHGGCRSAGCLPLTDTGIEQIYWLALQARAAGEARIPIDIFPARLDDDRWHELRRVFADEPGLLAFWTQLKQGYDTFARTHRPPQVSVDAGGRYLLAAAGS